MMRARQLVSLALLLGAALLPLDVRAAGGEISLLSLNDTANGQELSVKLQILVIMTLLGFLPAHPSHADIMWRLVVISAGSGTFFAPNARQIIFAAPLERAAAAGGLTQTTRMAGQVVGSTATATLLAMGIGSGPAPALVAAGLFSVSCLCSLALLGVRRKA